MSAVNELAQVVAKAITVIDEAIVLLKGKVDNHAVDLELMRTTMDKLERDNMMLHSRVAELTRRVQGG